MHRNEKSLATKRSWTHKENIYFAADSGLHSSPITRLLLNFANQVLTVHYSIILPTAPNSGDPVHSHGAFTRKLYNGRKPLSKKGL